MKAKLISLLMAAVMVVSLAAPMTSYAASDPQTDEEVSDDASAETEVTVDASVIEDALGLDTSDEDSQIEVDDSYHEASYGSVSGDTGSSDTDSSDTDGSGSDDTGSSDTDGSGSDDTDSSDTDGSGSDDTGSSGTDDSGNTDTEKEEEPEEELYTGPDMTNVTMNTSAIVKYISEDCYIPCTASVQIYSSSYTFSEGDEYTSISLNSSNSSVIVYWSLSNNVLSLQFYGSGSSTLTITLNEKVFQISVTLKNVYCSTDAVLLSPGKTKTVKVKGSTSGATIKWSSSNKKVATVTSGGKIKAKKAGNAIITATVNGEVKVGCVVSVTSAKKVKAIKKAISIYKSSSYSQAKRMLKGYYDCSSLVWRAYKPYGYYFGAKSYAPVAANIAKYLKTKGKLKGSYTYKKTQNMVMRAGDLIFKTGSSNGRFRGIYHVEMFSGYALAYYNSSGKAVVTTTWVTRSDGYADSGTLYGRP